MIEKNKADSSYRSESTPSLPAFILNLRNQNLITELPSRSPHRHTTPVTSRRSLYEGSARLGFGKAGGDPEGAAGAGGDSEPASGAAIPGRRAPTLTRKARVTILSDKSSNKFRAIFPCCNMRRRVRAAQRPAGHTSWPRQACGQAGRTSAAPDGPQSVRGPDRQPRRAATRR